MSANKIVERQSRAFVTCSIVKGGETAASAHGDAVLMWPWHGRYQDVVIRAFGLEGECVEFRFDSDDLRAALDQVAELRRELPEHEWGPS